MSASLISQIETTKSQPSVSTLYAITSALGISIEDVFATGSARRWPTSRGRSGETGPPSTVLEALGSARGSRLGPYVTPGAAPGAHTRLRCHLGAARRAPARRHGHFLLVTYHPGGTSSSNDGLMRHPGCEFGFLISGELMLTLGFEDIVLRPGDAFSFDSTTPHRYRNEGTEPAVGVWFVTDQH